MCKALYFMCCLLADDPEPKRALLPDGMYLVRAAVTEAVESPQTVLNTLRIEHVYGCDDGLAGETFTARSADRAQTRFGRTDVVRPSLHVGQKVIWLVKEANNKRLTAQDYNYVRWPIREDAPARSGWEPAYETIKSFAETVERVSRLDDRNDVVKELERLATDTNTYISSWAISRLSPVSLGSGETVAFFNKLLEDDKIPIFGQVELDKAQLGLHGPEWARSEARQKLFLRWFTGAPAEHEAVLVVMRLDVMTQHPLFDGFAQDAVLKLVTAFAKNDKLPLQVRQRAGNILGLAAERYSEGDEKVFETAVELASSDLPEEVRVRIAHVFVRSVVLNEARRDALTKRFDAEKIESVARVLKEALARPNGEPVRRDTDGRDSKLTKPSSRSNPK